MTYGVSTVGSVINVDDWEPNGNYLDVGSDVELPVFVRCFASKGGAPMWNLTMDRGVRGQF